MSDFDLKHIARLARLYFKEDELKVFKSQVGDILKFIEQLKEVKVEGVDPTSHPLRLANVFRDDKIDPSLPVEDFLKQSPGTRGRFFEVPKIIDEK